MSESIQSNSDPPLQQWPELLTVQQVAAYLQVKVSTICKWVCRNFIPHIKKGGMLRFRKTVIDKWMESKHGLRGRP